MTMVRRICQALVDDTKMIIVWLFLLGKNETFCTDLNNQHQRHLHFTHNGQDPLQKTPFLVKERSTLLESTSRWPSSTHS